MKLSIVILSWAAVCMGIVHIGFVFPMDKFSLGHLWFIGSGVAIILTGFINLLGQGPLKGWPHRILIPLANLIMCGLFIAATVVLKEPQVYIGIALFGALFILTLAARNPQRKKTLVNF